MGFTGLRKTSWQYVSLSVQSIINPHDFCFRIIIMHVKLHITINILVLLHSRGCSQFVCLDLCKLGFDCRNALAVLKTETNCVLLNNKHGLHLQLFLSSSLSLSLSLSLFLGPELPHAWFTVFKGAWKIHVHHDSNRSHSCNWLSAFW